MHQTYNIESALALNFLISISRREKILEILFFFPRLEFRKLENLNVTQKCDSLNSDRADWLFSYGEVVKN